MSKTSERWFLSVALLWILSHSCSSECHYDFRLSKTKCTHHDGSIWISGVQEKKETGAASTTNSVTSSRSRTSASDSSLKREGSSLRQRPAKQQSNDNVESTTSNHGSPWVASCFDRTCTPWYDSNRKRIEAHGGGMIQVANGTFYWYGESQKIVDHARGYGYSFGVNCYSAQNLGGPWVYEGMVLSQNSIWVKELSDSDRPFIIERPKVLFNERTNRYVMWFHLDAADTNGGHRRLSHRHRYWFRHAGVAMSTSPTGPFRFIHAVQPDNLPSLDLQVFEEANGAAYLIRSVNNEYVGMSRLTDDYLNTLGKGPVSTVKPCLEGMAVFRNPGDSTLYAIMSHLSGWEPNPLVLLRAHKTDSSGERGERCAVDCFLEDDIQWVDLGNPSHHAKSFNQQPTFVMALHDKQHKPYLMLMSDNWLYAGFRGLPDAGYIWLPLEFRHDATIGIRKIKNWNLDEPFDRKY